MWVFALLLLGVVLWLIGTGVWQAVRGQHNEPKSTKVVFEKIVVENLGLDPKRLEASTFLLSGPLAEELDITELFQDLEEEFGIKLNDSEAALVQTVGELWELVERTMATCVEP